MLWLDGHVGHNSHDGPVIIVPYKRSFLLASQLKLLLVMHLPSAS